jgi:hypothetical protein
MTEEYKNDKDMEVSEAINIIENTLINHLSPETDMDKFDNSYFGVYFDFGYRFNNEYFKDLFCRIFRVVSSFEKKIDYSYDFQDLNYSNGSLEFDYIRILGFNVIYKQKCLKQLLKDIYDFRKNFMYSKILDAFIPIDSFENYEKKELSKWILGHRDDECVVCYEKNKIFTSCGHNLCRICFHKSKKKCLEVDCDYCGGEEENLCIICPYCKQFLVHL